MQYFNWYWGLVASIITGAFLIKNVISQPYSQTVKGLTFYVDMIWFGIAYGIIDGLLLNVMPVVAAFKWEPIGSSTYSYYYACGSRFSWT